MIRDNFTGEQRSFRCRNKKNLEKVKENGPDVIRTHDLPVISRAHHRAMLRAHELTLNLP